MSKERVKTLIVSSYASNCYTVRLYIDGKYTGSKNDYETSGHTAEDKQDAIDTATDMRRRAELNLVLDAQPDERKNDE